MNLGVLTALGAVALCSFAALAASPALAAHSSKRSQCQRLRGVDRAPDRNVKLVKRLNRERLADGSRGSNLVGCVLPRGPLHTIATRKGALLPKLSPIARHGHDLTGKGKAAGRGKRGARP